LCTLGILFIAALGFLIQPGTDYFAGQGMSIEIRLHIITLIPIFFSALLLFLSFTIPQVSSGDEESNASMQPLVESETTLSRPSILKPMIAAVALCVAQQFTGINAIINYSGEIMKGLNPLAGNAIVMAWNFVTTLVSIPLSSKVGPRPTFIACTIIASLSCFVTGISAYPDVLPNGTVSTSVGYAGIALFVAVFEIGMGSFFWILAASIFPPHFKETGCGIINLMQFALNVAVNFGFPVAREGLSGGPSGNQNLGLAMLFFIFGGFGILTIPVLFIYLHQYEDKRTERF